MSNLRDPIPDNRGRGNVNLGKDPLRRVKKRSRIIIACLLLSFHVAVCLVLFFNNLEALAIGFLAIPLVFFLVFWYLLKAIDR